MYNNAGLSLKLLFTSLLVNSNKYLKLFILLFVNSKINDSNWFGQVGSCKSQIINNGPYSESANVNVYC